MSLKPNTLYYGDCLEWLPRFSSESVDLIYLDPPFNSNTDYNLLFGNGQPKGGAKSAQVRAFDDTWRWDNKAAERVDRLAKAAAHPAHRAVVALRTLVGEGGMLAYLSYMAERLAAMPRILKRTGSIYLHCDPTASHGLKLVMDTIFGPRNFRNEIIWKRTSGHSDAMRFGRVHDVVLYYTLGDSPTWNQTHQDYDPDYVDQYYRYRDDNGRRWMSGDLSASGLQGGGYEYEWRGVTRTWRVPMATMERLESESRIYYTRNGIARIKRYLDEMPGLPAQDLWTDLQALRSWHKERLGYPTQKPLALLERIIESSTNPGDMVLDPFCGCGTAVVAASKLNRRWAGIDVSPFAIDLICNRRFPEFKVPTEGYPYDLTGARKLAREQPFKFERWAVTRVPGLAPNDQQVGDGGIDGVGYLLVEPEETSNQVLTQVKGGKYQLGQLRDFMGVMERERAAIGVYTTVDPIRAAGARTEVANKGFLNLGASRYPRAQLWSIEDYFADRMPKLPALADPYTGKPFQGSLQMPLA